MVSKYKRSVAILGALMGDLVTQVHALNTEGEVGDLLAVRVAQTRAVLGAITNQVQNIEAYRNGLATLTVTKDETKPKET
jgi:hypothetical protein